MDRIQADLAQHLQAGMHTRAMGHVLVTVILALLLAGANPAAALMVWLAGMLLLVGAGVGWLRWLCGERASPADAAGRLRAFFWVEGSTGLISMLGLLAFLPDSDIQHRGMILIALAVWFAALMQSLSAHPPALYASWMPVFAGVLLVTWLRPGPYAAVALPVVAIWFLIIVTFTRRLHRMLLESLHLRHKADALAAALQIEKDRALALSQSRSRFLAAASHDLRQPVHALLLFVAALRHQPPADETRQLLGHVDDTVQAMERMFNGLLEMSRLDAGMVRPVPRATDLQRLLAPAVAEEAAVAGARGLSVTFTADARPLPTVASDPLMLERIVRNLLSNAVRYTQQGGVRLHIRRRPDGVDIRVADSGIGIAPEHQQSVYQEFFQLHAHTGVRTEGLGLGLAIVKRMCDLLGHRLTLRSRPGRGSIFTLRLPLALDLPAPGQPAWEAGDGTETFPGAAGVVVVVDEQAVTRLALRTLITGWGHRVLAVGDLNDLQNPFAGLDAAPCAIVCDRGPAGRALGMATIERLRMEFNEDIPAVLLIDPAHECALATQHLPGVAVLAKPVNEQSLRAALGAVLQPQA
jgi:signal transduction histidine kinase/CheY-like chemotaxis protein